MEAKRNASTEASFSKSGKPFSQSEIHKAKTTKETETKQDVLFTKRKAAPDLSSSLSREAGRFIALYEEQYREHRLEGTPRVCNERDAPKVQELLERHSFGTLSGLLDAFFAHRSRWIVEQEHSLHAFLHNVNILLLLKPKRAALLGSTRTRHQL